MNEWWIALDGFEKTLWTITLVATIIFVVQTIATFIGMDSDGGLDADFSGDMDVDADGGGDGHDHSPFQLFTFRNFINFFLGFGWSVITLEDKLGSRTMAVIIGIVIGALLVAAVMYMFYSLSKLAESGNMELKNAVNKTAQVYLPIPANKTGAGKIQVQIQGSLHELDAVTDGDALPTGTMTRVKEIMDNKFVLVEKI